jgi:hypothetical protein
MALPQENTQTDWEDDSASYAAGITLATAAQGRLGDVLMLDDGDLAFGELPVRSKSTSNNHQRGWALWNTFASIQQVVKKAEALVEDDVQSKQFQGWVRCFATFLLQYRDCTGQHYKPATISQYLSSFKKALSIKFPSVTQLQEDHDDAKWYSECYNAASRLSNIACAKRGEPTKDVKYPIQVVLLRRLVKALLDDSDPKRPPKYEDAAAIIELYHAIGRSSEVPLTSFTKMHWDPTEETLWCIWSELKVATNENDICFPTNTLEFGYLTDFNVSTGMHIITSGTKLCNVPGSLLFPTYASLNETGASARITRIIRELKGLNIGVSDEHSSHSLRKGAMDDLSTNPRCPHLAAFRRGGWKFPIDCAAVLYITSEMLVIIAGKALCGHVEPRQKVSAPTFDAIEDDDLRCKLQYMCQGLFRT